MKKYDLLRCADSIMRVLDVQKERVFVIDCINRKMPVWVESVSLGYCSECTVAELSEVTGINIVDVDDIGDADALDAR